MSPKKVQTRRVQPGEGRARRQVAEKYLEVASLIDSEDGAAINVCVGVAVLAGIAAADAICAAALVPANEEPSRSSLLSLVQSFQRQQSERSSAADGRVGRSDTP